METEVVEKTERKIGSGRRRYSNAFTQSPLHNSIMERYHTLAMQGEVSLVDFHAENIAPVLPEYKYESFRTYIRKLEEDMKAMSIGLPNGASNKLGAPLPESVAIQRLKDLVVSSSRSTREGIALALGIGLETLQKIALGQIEMSAKERAELLFKAMKAQDSRIAATRMIRQDNREQAVFESVFSEAAYQEENE